MNLVSTFQTIDFRMINIREPLVSLMVDEGVVLDIDALCRHFGRQHYGRSAPHQEAQDACLR
jgi:hypothetical protein